MYSSKIKQNINIHTDKILDIVKLDSNRICSYSKDKTIRIIKLENNKYSEIDKIDLGNFHAVQIEACDKGIVIVDNINNISFFTSKDIKYNYELCLKEENKILKMKKLSGHEIVYISEDKAERN